MISTSTSRNALLAWLLLLVLGSPGAWAAPDMRDTPAPKPGRVTMSELLRQELSSLRQLRHQRVELRRVKMGNRAIGGELRRIYTALGEVKRRRKGLQKVLAKRRAELRARVRALYRLVRATASLPLLDSRRARIPRDGRRALLRIVRRDLSELHHLRQEQQRLVKELQNVRRRRGQALAVLKDLARRRDRIGARVAQCKQEQAGVRYRRRHHKGHASEWNAQARLLEKKIGALTLQLRREAISFEHRKGKLARPVPGMIVKWFGERRVAGTKVTTLSKGVEISALSNWKVRTPAPGRIRFAGAVTGFRNVVIVDHDEGYLSVVGNLDKLLVKVGDSVGANRVIAMFSRRSRAVRPSIYFELRRSGQAIDPIPWLWGGLSELRKRGPKHLRRRAFRKPAPQPARRRPKGRPTRAATAQRD
jgi:septal ring factor EnvC (AmiA/AmiB activator)